jgi:hypothetical protein
MTNNLNAALAFTRRLETRAANSTDAGLTIDLTCAAIEIRTLRQCVLLLRPSEDCGHACIHRRLRSKPGGITPGPTVGAGADETNKGQNA